MGVVPGAALLKNECRTDHVSMNVWQIQFTLNDMLIAYKTQKCGDNWNKKRTAFHAFDPRPSQIDHPPKCRKPNGSLNPSKYRKRKPLRWRPPPTKQLGSSTKQLHFPTKQLHMPVQVIKVGRGTKAKQLRRKQLRTKQLHTKQLHYKP